MAMDISACLGFCDENDEMRTMDLCVRGFLMKPVIIGDLAEMVKKVLDEVNESIQPLLSYS